MLFFVWCVLFFIGVLCMFPRLFVNLKQCLVACFDARREGKPVRFAANGHPLCTSKSISSLPDIQLSTEFYAFAGVPGCSTCLTSVS